MGFWSRWFGDRETSEQKLARARAHLDDNEPKLAVAIVAKLDGPEADEIRRRARDVSDVMDQAAAVRPPVSIEPDADDPLRAVHQPEDDAPRAEKKAPGPRPARGAPYRTATPRPKGRKPPQAEGELALRFGADGSMTIGSGRDAITLNAPVSDDDGRSRSTDPIAVARRLLVATGDQPLDPRAFAFVEAALVLARAGEPAPAMHVPERRALVELVRAAATRDPDAVVAQVRSWPLEIAANLGHFATPLAVQFAARELADLVAAGRVHASLILVKALVRSDPDLCIRIVEPSADPLFAAMALLIAEDHGVELPALAARWVDWQSATSDQAAWWALAIRRCAARDLERALALADELAAEHGPDHSADRTLAEHLAKVDPARAIATAHSRGPHADHAGWLAGLVTAQASGVDELVDTWIDAFGPHTYDPWSYFADLLSACIELRDAERARRCIAVGGPTGWQIAAAAYHALARVPDAELRSALLAACYERVRPGVVAGRAIAFGALPLGAGRMIHQPAWLAFTDPHPLDTLVLPVALARDAPVWSL